MIICRCFPPLFRTIYMRGKYGRGFMGGRLIKVKSKVTERKTMDRESGSLRVDREQTIETPVMEGYVDMKLPEKSFFNNGRFITVFGEALQRIAVYGGLKGEECRLLLYLIGACQHDNAVGLDLNVLSELFGVRKPNISRALGGLIRRNIVVKRNYSRHKGESLPFNVSINYDQMNYNLAYNGRIKEYGYKKLQHPKIMLEGTEKK
jgi:hypothetical protein